MWKKSAYDLLAQKHMRNYLSHWLEKRILANAPFDYDVSSILLFSEARNKQWPSPQR